MLNYVILLLVAITAHPVLGQICPYSVCTCIGTVIDCSNKNLSAVPTRVDPGATFASLLLNGNKITNITGANILPVGLDLLDLSDNPISVLGSESLFGVSQTLRSIKFRNSAFTVLPPALEILDLLEILDIEGDVMTYPDVTVAKLAVSVQSLRVANSGLTGWPAWLSRFLFLRRLYLEGNAALGNPPAGFFDIWRQSLTHLSMSNIGASSFSATSVLSKLQWLDVSKNSVADAVSFSYDLIPFGNTLQFLDASNNGLLIEPRLADLRVLSEVHLSNNRIASVNTGAFATSIVTIYLDNNRLTSVPNFLRDLPQVQFLNLQNNNITSVGAFDFPVNSRLTTVYLGENPLSTIDEHGFDNFREYLLYLNLQNTRLIRLPLALTVLARLQTLWMTNNSQLVCTCDEKALTPWLATVPYIKIAGQCGAVDIKDFFTQLAGQCP